MTKINIGNQRGKTQPFIAILIIKSLIKRGRWYMTAIAVERWPEENQAGGFFFSTAATVFFANSSEGVDLVPCEKWALARMAASKGLYNFHSGIWL